MAFKSTYVLGCECMSGADTPVAKKPFELEVVTKAKKIGESIDTELKARGAILVCIRTLKKAHSFLKEYGINTNSLVHDYNIELIESGMRYVERVSKELDKGLTKDVASKIGLCIIQTARIAETSEKLSNDSRYGGLRGEFFDALRQVIQFAVDDIIKPTISAVVGPFMPLLIIIGIGLVVVLAVVK